MKFLKFLISVAIVFIQPCWAVDYDYFVPLTPDELKSLYPGKELPVKLPDGSSAIGIVRDADSNPTGRHEMWLDTTGNRDFVPDLDKSNKSGFDFSGAVGSGAIAGGTQLAIQGIYNGLIMTPSKVTEIENAQKNFEQSNSALKAANDNLNQDFRQGMNEAARAIVKAGQSLNNVPAAISEPAHLPAPHSQQTQQKINSASPDFQSKAQPIYNQLNSKKPQNPIEQEAQNIGNSAIDTAATASAQGQLEISETALGIAKQMANLLVGLDPVTGTARFGYEVFSGKNMITGEELGSWERAFSGAAFAASLVILGTSATMVNALKGCLAVAESTKSGAGLLAAIVSLREAKRVTDTLRTMGWAEKEIANFAKFNRTVLNGTIQDLDYSIYAFNEWSAKAKDYFPQLMEQMKLSGGEAAKASKDFGIDQVTFLERRAKAIGFYNNTPGFERDVVGIQNNINGIDFSETVNVTKIKEGTELYAWHVTGTPVGSYATREITPAWKLGVGPLGRFPDGSLVSKELRSIEVTKDTFALESKAAEFNDTRSLQPGANGKNATIDFDRDGNFVDNLQYAPGGAKQLFFDKSVLRLKP